MSIYDFCASLLSTQLKKIKLMSIHIIRTKRRKQKKGDEANQGKNGHNLIKWELFYEREQVFFFLPTVILSIFLLNVPYVSV